MASDVERPSAAMEAGGFYNKYSLIPSGGGALALPHLERAVADVPLELIDEPIVIADYGSSQGLNSVATMRLAIESVRRRSGADRPIMVYHVDQPSNDFNALFGLLDQSPNRLTLHDSRVFPCAIGRSFYENVLPPNSVRIGWSSYAAMRARRIPALIPGHFAFQRSTGEVREHGSGREPRIGSIPFSQSAGIESGRLFGCLGSRRR